MDEEARKLGTEQGLLYLQKTTPAVEVRTRALIKDALQWKGMYLAAARDRDNLQRELTEALTALSEVRKELEAFRNALSRGRKPMLPRKR